MSTEAIGEEQALSDFEKESTLKKVVGSSFLGNFIEWFDYASYSYLAVVITAVFFPSEDRMVGMMLTFGLFALSYLVRPLGAIFWGNMGDKKGRKWALSTSILIMSGATFLIGCLPGYGLIGVAAPLLLLVLRILQSFSAAGEYAGASTFIAEYAPSNHRGFYCSMVPASTAVGLLLGSFVASALFGIWGASSDFVVNWGWRIPFWLAGPLGYITHYIRTNLEDSPVYTKMLEDLDKKGEPREEHPIRVLFTKHFRKTIIAFGCCVLNAIGFYVVLTYMPNYLSTVLGYNEANATIITNIVLIVYIALIFISGRISDKVGRKKMLIIACIGFIVLTIPCFMLMSTLNFAIILVAELVMALMLTINDGTLASYLNETFPTKVRYSGFAFTFNLANAIFGGSASAVCFWLINSTGNSMAPAFYMIGISVIALIAMIASHEHTGKHLSEVD